MSEKNFEFEQEKVDDANDSQKSKNDSLIEDFDPALHVIELSANQRRALREELGKHWDDLEDAA